MNTMGPATSATPRQGPSAETYPIEKAREEVAHLRQSIKHCPSCHWYICQGCTLEKLVHQNDTCISTRSETYYADHKTWRSLFSWFRREEKDELLEKFADKMFHPPKVCSIFLHDLRLQDPESSSRKWVRMSPKDRDEVRIRSGVLQPFETIRNQFPDEFTETYFERRQERLTHRRQAPPRSPV